MPLARGYSRETISRNIRILIREGKTPDQAAAIAFAQAREHFRAFNPGAKLPAYLDPKRNPVARQLHAGKRASPQGKRLYSGFMKRSAVTAKMVRVPALPREALAIGFIRAIIYESDRDGVSNLYRHDFSKGSRPLLAVSSDGKQLIPLGGAYRFTSRGIVDR